MKQISMRGGEHRVRRSPRTALSPGSYGSWWRIYCRPLGGPIKHFRVCSIFGILLYFFFPLSEFFFSLVCVYNLQSMLVSMFN